MYDSSSILTGNITRDPEHRSTTSGKGIASFGLAVNRRYQVNGDWQEQTSFFDVVAWGELGKRAAESLHKGDRVVVVGRMEQRTWEADDGTKRTKVEMVAADIGASVRFANVTIARVPRADQSSPPDHARAEDGVPAVPVGVGAASPAGEEPF
ncbi:single-stranded DNA-binding protein [Desertimonas flava]|uniref:single-stranded DNA-binding protein n=1 Tax=Desertimonas flava TaxID=2064846 RepID=UPI000E346859|nr:single-stranded DNA-binding protein [Desertimonas flava]